LLFSAARNDSAIACRARQPRSDSRAAERRGRRLVGVKAQFAQDVPRSSGTTGHALPSELRVDAAITVDLLGTGGSFRLSRRGYGSDLATRPVEGSGRAGGAGFARHALKVCRTRIDTHGVRP